MATTTTQVPYVLGVSEDEVRRLTTQSDVYREATEDALRRTGIGPGMTVLDVGTGTGGVAEIVSEMVGPEGSVTGVDASETMLAIAKAQAALHDVGNVSFHRTDLQDFAPEATYDAVTGRLILMHLADPTDVVRRLATALRPGGLMVFADFAISGARQVPEGALFSETLDHVIGAFRRAGLPTDMGFQLGRIFRDAGLPSPRFTVGGVVGEGSATPVYGMLAGITRTLLPVMERFGIADAESVDVATLEERLRAEAGVHNAVACPPLLVTAWTRIPG